MTAPLALMAAPGSRGDVNPMLGLARELRGRGWRVHLAISQPYAHLVESIGCKPEICATAEQFQSLLGCPEVWRTFDGARLIFQRAVPEFLASYWPLLKKRYEPGRTVLISHPLDFASKMFQRLHPEVPLVSVHLAPATFIHHDQPARMTRWGWETRGPAWLRRVAYRMAERSLVRPWFDRPLRQFFRQPGVTFPCRPLESWMTDGDAVLAFFPSWFGPDLDRIDRRIRTVGFPCYDGPEADQEETRQTMERLLLGEHRFFTSPPMVFTAGTAHQHAAAFFAMAAEACRAMEVPGLLLSAHSGQLPTVLPPQVASAGYLPLARLLPHVRLLVHHGGIGTTSQALAAGIPQLVLPMAFDQFDNAQRVARLGCGRWLAMGQVREKTLRASLHRLLSDSAYTQDADRVSQRFSRESGLVRAADQIVEIARTRLFDTEPVDFPLLQKPTST